MPSELRKFIRIVVIPFVVWTLIGAACFRQLSWGANLGPDDTFNVLALVYMWPAGLLMDCMNLLAVVLRG